MTKKGETMTKTNEDVHRVEFDDGNWWDFRTVVTRGMRKRFSADGIGALDLSKQNGTFVDIADPDQITTYLQKNPAIASRYMVATDDALLVNGSVAWSFDGPITLEAIDSLPDDVVTKVLEEVRPLYRPITEEEVKN